MDWGKLFIPDYSLLALILRGSILYLALFMLLRFVFRREAGSLGLTDLLVLVLIADAAQNAMAGDYQSITGGLVLVGTIVGWSYFLDWLGFRFERIGRLLHPPPLRLVNKGRMIHSHMRRELVTKDELMSQLREQGIEDLRQVKAAFLEADGRLSVIREDRTSDDGPTEPPENPAL